MEVLKAELAELSDKICDIRAPPHAHAQRLRHAPAHTFVAPQGLLAADPVESPDARPSHVAPQGMAECETVCEECVRAGRHTRKFNQWLTTSQEYTHHEVTPGDENGELVSWIHSFMSSSVPLSYATETPSNNGKVTVYDGFLRPPYA